MRLKFFFFLCLSLLTIIGAQAESVTFNVCSWDAKNKSVTITQLTHDCNPIEGQHWDWMPLGENGKETWYVVKGSDVSRKVLVIFGTVHLVLPDGSKLTCNHIKLEARNNAILHVHGQSSFPGKLNVINYSPDGTREYKDAAAIGSGGGEGNGSGSLYVHSADILAEQERGYEGLFSKGSNGSAIGGGKRSGIDPSHRVVVYDGSVKASGGFDGACIGGGHKGNQGGPVIIYGGSVETVSKAAGNGAGIGGGNDGDGGRVEIYGGTVIAKSNENIGAGIGGGDGGNGGDVHIYGGDVKAYGSMCGAAIGGSNNGKAGTCEITGGTVYACGGKSNARGSVGPTIGGGNNGEGGYVTITGGTVTVEKGWTDAENVSLIGGSVTQKKGSVEIGPGMKVSYKKHDTSLTLVNSADKRVEALHANENDIVNTNIYALVEPCNHQGTDATYTQIDDNQHNIVCKACGHEGKENHKYTDGKCLCGKEEKKEPEIYTITLNFSPDGKTYLDMDKKVVQGKEFTLPVPEVQNGLIFKGYLKATTVDGIEMTDSEEGTLLEGGTTVTPDANACYYARYRYDYKTEWTWNDERTEASVKITNNLLEESKTLTATITEDTEKRVEPTETTMGERYFEANVSYTRKTGVTYQFSDNEILVFFSDTNPKVTLDAQSKDNANSETLFNYLGMKVDVTINNLTLKKDNKVHPICLPFYASNTGSTPLNGAIIYELSGVQLKNHEFSMSFTKAAGVKPGVPSFYRFEQTGADVKNPVFENVVIDEYIGSVAEKQYTSSMWSVDDETLELWGTFEPEVVDEEERELFFLMDGDGISLKPETLQAFGSYFFIASPTDEQGNSIVRSVWLGFESDDAFRFSKKLTYSWDGDGSETNPYMIKSPEQLNEMQEAMNGTEGETLQGMYFRQGANITFEKTITNNYTPVKTFKAHYDGNGFVISGMNVNAAGSADAALFLDMAEGSSVKNVILKNSTITGSTAGGIATRFNGTASIENCHVLKDVTITSNNNSAGGIVAYMSSGTPTVKDCSSHAQVTAHQSNAGGVVGMMVAGSLSNAIYLGNSITAHASYKACAVVGNYVSGTMENCYFTATTLTDAKAALMPQSTVDNTDFLTLMKTRDESVKTAKTDLTVSDINYDITLNGHTLYKDNTWNTLYLPFTIEDISGTPLDGAAVKQLTNSTYETAESKLVLNFNTPSNATRINAGDTYFVKWEGTTEAKNPTFTGVTIGYVNGKSSGFGSGYVNGTLKPVTLKADDRKKLFLGANNKLYYPNDDVTINSFHAYLELSNDYIAGDPDAGSNGVRSIVLDFGEGETTSIEVLKNGRKEELKLDGVWYDLSGRKVADSSRSSLLVPRSSKKGIYIVNGKKVIVK